MDKCLKEFEDKRDVMIIEIEKMMREYDFGNKVEEFKERYMNYREVLFSKI